MERAGEVLPAGICSSLPPQLTQHFHAVSLDVIPEQDQCPAVRLGVYVVEEKGLPGDVLHKEAEFGIVLAPGLALEWIVIQ